MIVQIDFDSIYKIWSEKLWPGRQSKIEANSAMEFLGGYDMFNMSTTPTFFGIVIDGNVVGTNSGHMCKNNQYRSRGLYVEPEYRKNGYGKLLLTATIEQGKKEGATLIWSLPKKTSINTYQSAGFVLASDWFPTETSDFNAYVKIDI